MAKTRPRTRWKRLTVIAVALVLTWSYAVIAWLSGSVVWPVKACEAYLSRHASRQRIDAQIVAATPFRSDDGGGYIGLPGTNIWAIVPQGVSGTRFAVQSEGIHGLRPAIRWDRWDGDSAHVVLTTVDAVKAGPAIAYAPGTDGNNWWTGLRETLDSIIADAALDDVSVYAYSVELDMPEGWRRRLDVDLEYGVVVILSWRDEFPEPGHLSEFFTVGEQVPVED